MPALVIPLLWQYQLRVRATPHAVGALVALFAFYGAANTHDYLAAGRARQAAASGSTAAGIPRTSITAGLEYDGWTELEHSDHFVDADFVFGLEGQKARQGCEDPGGKYRLFAKSANG